MYYQPTLLDKHNPLLLLTIKRMRDRHLVDENGHALIDFSTQCYLGLDNHPDIIQAQIEGLRTYGNVVPWSRSVAIFDLFEQAERALAALVGGEATNLFISTTLLNHGVIPALSGSPDSLIAFEKFSHLTSFEGALIAQAKGAQIIQWQDEYELESILKSSPHTKKLIITDGVNSMSGDYADLPVLDVLAKKHGAILYVDDAHGFGVVGENPSDCHPYGQKGSGLVRYFNLSYDNILYVGCFSKAYGLPGAFIVSSRQIKEFLLTHATPHDLGFSGQASVIKGLLKAFEINAHEGNLTRNRIYEYTQLIVEKLTGFGFSLHRKETPFPIITIAIREDERFLKMCQMLYRNGILATAEPSTVTSYDACHLLRLTITNGLSHRDIEHLIAVFSKIKNSIL